MGAGGAINGLVVATQGAAFRLGDWEVRPNDCRLLRYGNEVKLSPRSMSVLVVLAQRAGESITHLEILSKLWHRGATSPNGVYKCIAELRHALDDAEGEPSYIETVPKRGYRLTVDAQPLVQSRPALPTSARRAVPLPATSVVLRHDHEQSVAVLRFVNIGDDPANEYLAFGIADALLNALARVPHLKVTSRTHSFQFDPLTSRLQDLGVALGVDYLLEGSVQREGNKLRALAQFVRVDGGFRVFSTKVDRSLKDIFSFQDEVAEQVVRYLRIYVDDRERERMLDWGTLNVDAYLLALEGWYHNKKWSEGDAKRAIELFDQALGLDDGLVWAYVGAVDAMHRLYSYLSYAESRLLSARATSYRNRAAMHGASAEQLHWMDFAIVVFEGRGHRAVELMLRRRIASTGGSLEELRQYGRVLGGAGLFDEGLRYMAPAAASPELPWTELEVVSVEAAQRGIEWSIIARRELLTRHPQSTGHMMQLVIDLAMVGEFGEARTYLARLQSLDATGRMAFSAEANLKLLSGDASMGSDTFEALLADSRNSNFMRGQLCFIGGDVVRGCGYWSKLVGASLSHLSYHLHKVEQYFPRGVVDDPLYLNTLDTLGIGWRWTQFLRECVKELAPVSGIELTTLNASASARN